MKKIVLFLCLLGFLNFANSEWVEITDGLTDEALNSVTGLAKDSDGNVYAGVAGVDGNGLYKFDFDNNSWEKIIGSPTYGSTQNPHIVQGTDGNDYVYSRSHILNLSDIDSGWSRPERVPDEIVEKYDPKEYSDAERLQTHFYMQTVTAGEGRFLVASRKGNQILLTYDPVSKEWEDLNFPHKKTRGRLREVDGVIFYTPRDEGLFAYQNGEWTRITNNRRVFRGEVVSQHSGMAFGWNGNADDREIYYSYTPVNATQITSDRVLKMDGYTFSEETSGTWEERDTGGRFPSHVLVDSSREEYNRGSGYAFGCRPLLDIAYCVDGRFGGYFKLENGISEMPDYTKSLPVSLGDTSLRVGDSVASGNDIFFLIRYNDEKTLKKMTFDENTHGQIATNFDTDYSSYLESKNPKGGAVLESGDILIGGNLDDQSYLFEYNSNYELQNQTSLTGELVYMQGSINNKYTGILTTQKLYLYEDGNKAWAFDVSDKNILVNDYGNDKQQKNRISVGDDGKIALLYDKNIAVFEDEEIIYEEYFGKTYANDIAINSDKNHIYVTGYQQFNNLQVAVIFAYEIGKEGIIWDTWNFNRDELSATENMADTRGYRIQVGQNGDLYFAGESAGGNTIFRWNGKDLTTGTLNGGDMYNASWGISGAAHLGYLGRIDTNNGEVKQGQIIVPRLSNGNGNTFRSKYGEINIDNDGNVVFMATSACCGPNRDFLLINGERLGEYIGADNILYVTDETLNERILWTSLSANNYGEEQGKSVSRGVLVGDDVFYVLNEVEDGEVFTTNNANISSRNKEGQSQIVQVQLGESTRVFDFDGEDIKEEHKSIAINNISTTELIKYDDSEINVDIDLENVSNNDVLEIHLKSSVDDDQVFADKILSLDSLESNISASLELSGVGSYDLDNMILDVSVYDDYKGGYSDIETLNIDFQAKEKTTEIIESSYNFKGWDNGGVNRDDFNVIEADPSNYTDKVSDLEPGDWLELTPGNYTNNLRITNMHGTKENPIVISGPQDGTATFVRKSGSNTIQISGSSYVVLKDFDMNGGGSGRRGDAIQPRNSASHHIVLEGLHIYNYSNRIALNTNNVALWDWILRDNIIENKSTGIYIGDASGNGEAFVGGLIEGNVFKDTTGYNMQIKHQNYRDDVDGMPQDTRQTIIRNNTFKDAGDGRFRPNLLLGHFPSSGAGSDDMYLVYNNLFYNNHAGHRNVQTDSTVAFYNNIFANNNGGGIFVTDHNNNPKDIYIFRNTFNTDSTAVQIRGVNTDYEQIVKGNAVFANSPFSLHSNVEESDNFTRDYNEVSNYIDNTNYEPINDELKKGSINYGIELEDFDIDYNQNPRYVATYGAVSFEGEAVEPETYEVTFNISPEEVEYNLKVDGDDNFDLENVEAGSYEFEIKAEGYETYTGEFEIVDSDKTVDIGLEKERKEFWTNTGSVVFSGGLATGEKEDLGRIGVRTKLDESSKKSNNYLNIDGAIKPEGDWDGVIKPPQNASGVNKDEIEYGESKLGDRVKAVKKLGANTGVSLKSDTENGFEISFEVEDGEVGKTYDIIRSTDAKYWSKIDAECELKEGKVCRFFTNQLSYFAVVDSLEYELEIFVKDDQGDDLDAKIQIGSTTKTGSNVIFDLDEGSYDIKLTKDGYDTKEKTVELDGDKEIQISLDKKQEDSGGSGGGSGSSGGGGGGGGFVAPPEDDKKEKDEIDDEEDDDLSDQDYQSVEEDDKKQYESADDIYEEISNIQAHSSILEKQINLSSMKIKMPQYDSEATQQAINNINKQIVDKLKSRRVSGFDLAEFVSYYNNFLAVFKIYQESGETKPREKALNYMNNFVQIINSYNDIKAWDVYDDAEFENSIGFLNAYGVTSFNNIYEYRPDFYLTREEAAHFVSNFAERIVGLEKSDNHCEFEDIDGADETLVDSIQSICRMSIMRGTNGRFYPSSYMTRAEFFAVLIRAISGESIEESGMVWWENYFDYAQKIGITKEEDLLAQNRPISRYQAALIMYRIWMQMK
ncbi:S-layer homology domain-containing protein [Candidatus Absconditicoccus praedator]|uniref:S-layer homology domain-containing protein n=1 Tax=Candidatus Absconditicoccus praedator TaxID=2735562 RepID=UPI001E433A89|nr:S-layer homology domain-containing protein [Candidatus Absconditicoccus praedator]UFX82767.1 S-layer homology domain-containing protein [Candidatus Absconditicoccus praedator]